MFLSRGLALEKLIKWNSDNRPLFLIFEDGWFLRTEAFIKELSADSLEIGWEGGSVFLGIFDARFEEIDPSEIRSLYAPTANERFVSCLKIWFPRVKGRAFLCDRWLDSDF